MRNLTDSDGCRWNVTTTRWESYRWLPAAAAGSGAAQSLPGRSGTTFSGAGTRLTPRPPRAPVDWAAGLTAHFGATGVERRQGGTEASHPDECHYEHIA